MKEKEKIIVILGQTATGKSDFAVEIAKEFNGEIVSADSRQVYKGMNLGTGKITKKEIKGVPHYLLDIVSPKSKTFSVVDFQKLAQKKIEKILSRNKIPIICGGTGYYIDSILNNIIFPKVPPNKELRKELSLKTPDEIFNILKKLDKKRADEIDKNNTVRIIRAIEIAQALGKVPILKKNKTKYQFVKIGLEFPDDELKERIKIRLKKRIKLGMIEEVRRLKEKGVSWKKLYSFGLEYRFVSGYLRRTKNLPSSELKKEKEKMEEELFSAIWNFAKRQKTWFKRDKEIIWINPSKKRDIDMAKNKINDFLKK